MNLITKYGLLIGTIISIIIQVKESANIAMVSNYYKQSYTPVSWAFSIWGLIYAMLLYISYKQCVAKKKDNDIVSSIYAINGLLTVWVLFWINGLFFLSLVSIVVLYIILYNLSRINEYMYPIFYGITSAWVLGAVIQNGLLATNLLWYINYDKDFVLSLLFIGAFSWGIRSSNIWYYITLVYIAISIIFN